MTVRLHIGNGAVLLKDYVNIDLPGPSTFLAKDRPDLVNKLETTEHDYYGRHKDKNLDSLREGPLNQETVCDAYGSLDNIPAAYWSVSEVLIVHVWEHLSISEAHKALDQIDGIMEPNGVLRIDVPDHIESLHRYLETRDAFFERHLLGPRNTERGYHLVGYTREFLIKLVEEHGFVYDGDDPRQHLYPSISVRFKKPGPRAPRDYAWPPPYDVPDSWRVLDVGPGSLPLQRADAYLDHDYRNLKPLKESGKNVYIGDLMSGLPEIPDKSYDFIWASHCLEHVASPQRAAATLSRIGKRGVVVLPSAWKESLTNFEESTHAWQCLPHPVEGKPPIFIRSQKQIDQLKNVDVMKIFSRIFRTGPNRIPEEQRVLRKWWYNSEPSLDIVFHWQDRFELQVIE